ncbi:small RNA degrading nuclease 3 isoform X2 [Neltuma alba]|uniref:small RNA degrading nuclease 3 isoform X2 n=1 Tax=Neltuma alba TaxID=207710 RepID=UPI0010A44F14|nr:small RNA degrading nuclease 3-like isoform X2 [Prosopis alba]
MEEKIDVADRTVLVDIVKLVQKRRMQGALGDWKNFLMSHDKKFGSNLSDPAKRSRETLVAFLKTFSKEGDLKIFDTILRRYSNKDLFGLFKDKSCDIPEQRLVQNTLQHPSYPLDYAFEELDEDWVVINLRKKNMLLKSTKMVAIDCEMVLCEDGTEAVVSLCVVDRNLKVILKKLVRPNKAIADYRSGITGVCPQDLEGVTCSLANIQNSLRMMLLDGTILVGHSLHNDLRALKLDYVRVIDTSYIFQYSDGNILRRPSLNALCKAVLGYELRQTGAPHNCVDDAMAAMKLVLAKIERGVDNAIPLAQEPVQVPQSEMAKLLLHKISSGVTSEELYKIVPGDFILELRPPKGNKYSALAIFKNPQEAHEAFESLQGNQEKDSFGRPQKHVTFKLKAGVNASIFVRKMAPDGPNDSKRALEADETTVLKKAKMDPEIEGRVSKKAKMDPEIEVNATAISNKCDCDTHLNEIEALNQRLKENDLEIESLKQQLKQKDCEISILNKMVSSLNKKLRK